MTNAVNIPYQQSKDPIVNQIQQYVNRVNNAFNSDITTLKSDVSQLGVLGEVRLSPLTLAQFQSETNSNWIQANGQSCVNTAYAKLTGNTTVPTITITGTNAFIRVN